MLPPGLVFPSLSDPYATAFRECMEHVFRTYQVVGVLATGTVIRGTGDARSDLDIHVLHLDSFRERVQLWFNGVPCEIFVNPPHRIPAYFTEDREDRRPVSQHMFSTGIIAFDPQGEIEKLVDIARSDLVNPPVAPSEFASTLLRYSVATEFEDVLDLAERDTQSASILLGAVVRRLCECRIAHSPGWAPRAKDLVNRLGEIDAGAAELAIESAADLPFEDRLAAARKLCLHVTQSEGFFEWTSPREVVESP